MVLNTVYALENLRSVQNVLQWFRINGCTNKAVRHVRALSCCIIFRMKRITIFRSSYDFTQTTHYPTLFLSHIISISLLLLGIHLFIYCVCLINFICL